MPTHIETSNTIPRNNTVDLTNGRLPREKCIFVAHEQDDPRVQALIQSMADEFGPEPLMASNLYANVSNVRYGFGSFVWVDYLDSADDARLQEMTQRIFKAIDAAGWDTSTATEVK